MLSREELIARLRGPVRGTPTRNCPMDMSPASIACREGRKPAPPRRAPPPRFIPEVQPPTIMPVEPPPQEVFIPEIQQPIRMPPRRRPEPVVDDSPCPPYPIICNQSMSPDAVACREKARRCATPRFGNPIPRPVRPVLTAPPQFDRGVFTPSFDGLGASITPLVGEGKRRRGRKKKDEELHGGFFSALASLGRMGATLGRTIGRVVPTVTRAVPTATRGATAITRAVPTVTRGATAVTRGATATSRLGALGSTALRGLNVAGIGLGVGLPIYQIVEMKKQQAEADRLAGVSEEQAKANQKAIDDAVNAANAQQKFYEDASIQAEKDRAKMEADYAKAEAEAKKAYEEQAKRDADAMAQAQKDQEAQIALLYELEAQRQQQIEEAIRGALGNMFGPYVPPQQPVAPPPTQRPVAPQQPYVPPPQQPVAPPPSRGRAGKPRVGNGKRGRPRKVQFDY